MIKAVLFDFDGVLTLEETGSHPICAYISAVAGVGLTRLKKEYISYTPDLLSGKLTHTDIWDDLCRAVGQPIDLSLLTDAFIQTPMNFEMLALVRRLKENGYKIGMVTDNRADRIHAVIGAHPWGRLFDGLAISAEVGSGKAQEQIFLRISDVLAVRPEECVFIDNLKENLIAPKALGMETIFFDFARRDVAALEKMLVDLHITP